MRQIIIMMMVMGMMGHVLGASAIQDVKKTDPTYPAIKRSVDKGYLAIYEGGKFMPNRSVTRKEMSLILSKIAQKDASVLGLSKAEMQELTLLAKNFKRYLADQDTTAMTFGSRVNLVEKEQKVIHYDMSAITNELSELRGKHEKQKKFTLVALAIAGLGLLL